MRDLETSPDIIKSAQQLAELKVPPLRAEVTVHEDEDPRYVDDCLVQIIEKDDENSIWYEEEHGGYEHGKLHFAHVFAAAPALAQELSEETWEYGVEYKYLTNRGAEWRLDPGVGWHKTCRDAERAASASVRYRIVRRRVSPPEVVSE